MHARTHRAALAGLGAAILLLASFGIWSAVRTNVAAKRAASAVRWSDVYQQARFAVGQEESLERKYRLEPSPEVRHQYSLAVAALESSLERVTRGDVGPGDRAEARHLLAVHAQYLGSIDRMYAAVDAGDFEGALALDAQQVDPRFGVIASTVNAAAREHRRLALQSLGDLRVTESGVEIASSLVFVVGLVLLGFFAVLLTRVNRAPSP